MKKHTEKQPTHPAPAASTADPICQSSKTPRHWKLPSIITKLSQNRKLIDLKRNGPENI